jgi:hypothetical protein
MNKTLPPRYAKAIKNGGVSGAWNLHKNPNIKKQIPEWI